MTQQQHVATVEPVPVGGPAIGLAGYRFVCSCGARGPALVRAAAQQAAVEHAVGHPVKAK